MQSVWSSALLIHSALKRMSTRLEARRGKHYDAAAVAAFTVPPHAAHLCDDVGDNSSHALGVNVQRGTFLFLPRALALRQMSIHTCWDDVSPMAFNKMIHTPTIQSF